MSVPETDRRIRRHHVDIAFAVDVPEVRTLTAAEHHRQGPIIRSAEARLSSDVISLVHGCHYSALCQHGACVLVRFLPNICNKTASHGSFKDRSTPAGAPAVRRQGYLCGAIRGRALVRTAVPAARETTGSRRRHPALRGARRPAKTRTRGERIREPLYRSGKVYRSAGIRNDDLPLSGSPRVLHRVGRFRLHAQSRSAGSQGSFAIPDRRTDANTGCCRSEIDDLSGGGQAVVACACDNRLKTIQQFHLAPRSNGARHGCFERTAMVRSANAASATILPTPPGRLLPRLSWRHQPTGVRARQQRVSRAAVTAIGCGHAPHWPGASPVLPRVPNPRNRRDARHLSLSPPMPSAKRGDQVCPRRNSLPGAAAGPHVPPRALGQAPHVRCERPRGWSERRRARTFWSAAT